MSARRRFGGLTCRDEKFAGILGDGDVRMASGELDAHLRRLVGHGCWSFASVSGREEQERASRRQAAIQNFQSSSPDAV